MIQPCASPNPLPAPAPGAVPRLLRGAARRLGAPALLALVLTSCYSLEPKSASNSTNFSFRRNPCLPGDTLRLAVAEAQLMDCSNGGTTVTLAGAGASYLVVPEFATDQVPFQFVLYAVDSGAMGPAAAASRMASARARPGAGLGAARALGPARFNLAQRTADARLRARGRRLAMAGAFRSSGVLGQRAAQRAIRTSVPAQGSIRTFHVLSNLFGTINTWAPVDAQLAYVGTNILLYVDTLAPPNGFTPSQLQTYGQYFDQTLFPIDTTAFGAPSDIDGNGRVIVLMSNVVNADTPSATCASTGGYVAGFFNEEDFTAAASDPHSNQGEIFYTILPDPNGQLSCAHSVADLQYVVPPTFLHELQHLVNFAQHVVVDGGTPGASWLDEGLSIAAEELGSIHYELQCPGTACRTDPTQLFPDSAQPFIGGFLYDSYEFALLPDTVSILLENDGDPGSSWRGGAWLLVRWLVDQKGSGVYRRLEHGSSDGVAAIAAVMGEPFPQVFADFGLALYTDSLPGLPRATAPAPNRFTTRNLRQLWARLYTTSGPASDIPYAMPVQLFPVPSDTTTYVLYPGTVTYFRLDTPANSAAVSIQFAGPSGLSFVSSLQPQLAIFRLPPGQ